MQFTITGKHLDITPAMREHVEKTLAHIEQNHHTVTNAHVTLQIDRHEKIAEANLHVANSGEIHASARHNDMYIAIDQLGDKLARQLQRAKDKYY